MSSTVDSGTPTRRGAILPGWTRASLLGGGLLVLFAFLRAAELPAGERTVEVRRRLPAGAEESPNASHGTHRVGTAPERPEARNRADLGNLPGPMNASRAEESHGRPLAGSPATGGKTQRIAFWKLKPAVIPGLEWYANRTLPEDWARPFPQGARSGRSDGGAVHVVIASDEAQLPGVVGCLLSTVRHSATAEALHFHLVVPRGSEQRVRNFLACRGVHPGPWHLSLVAFDDARARPLIRVDIHQDMVSNLTSGLNYARFFLAELLPNLRHALWLDADTVVQGDVVALVRGLGDEFVAGAVPWAEEYRSRYWRPILHKKFARRYGILMNGTETSFNAGVVVYNLASWEAKNLTQEIEWWAGEHVANYKGLWNLGSQPLLHMVLYRRWTPLAGAWNVAHLGSSAHLSAANISRARVLHWTGRNKPWMDDGFYHYAWRPHSGLPECLGKGRCNLAARDTARACIAMEPFNWTRW